MLAAVFGGGCSSSESSTDSDPLRVRVADGEIEGELFYDGETIVETHDVVVVSANYRLGALGSPPMPTTSTTPGPPRRCAIYSGSLMAPSSTTSLAPRLRPSTRSHEA